MIINIELKDLTPNDLEQAIKSENTDDLRDLIISKYEEAKAKQLKLENFYYAYHVACSDEVFDMFSFKSIESIFNLYGYQVDWKTENKDLDEIIGTVTVSKDDFSFKMVTVAAMHDSLYSDFVDTKTAEILLAS